MKVSHIISIKGTDVITIGPRQTVREAAITLARYNIGALVVVDGEQVVGILSERDIIHRAAEDESVLSRLVADIMTPEVVTGLPQDDLMSVANVMTEKRFRHLPVVEDGRLLGIVSIGDILKAQRDAYQGEIDTLETQIMADS